MTRKTFWLFPVIGISVSACAGELSNPERFEVGQSAATTADAGRAGAPVGDAGASTCGSTIALLTSKCGNAGCHGAASPAAGLDLASADLGARLRDVAASASCDGYSIIDSKDPSRSLLYLKVTDTPPCAPRMPIGTPLSDTEQSCLLAWIEQL